MVPLDSRVVPGVCLGLSGTKRRQNRSSSSHKIKKQQKAKQQQQHKMKITFSSAFLATLVVAHSANPARAGGIRGLKRQPTRSDRERGAGEGRRRNVGKPSRIEFNRSVSRRKGGLCFGFDKIREGEELKAVSCSRAREFIYGDDYLLQLRDDKDLCLKGDRRTVSLYKCDRRDKAQQFFFLDARIKRDFFYTIANGDRGDFIELVDLRDGEIDLRQGRDRIREEQLIEELPRDFFPGRRRGNRNLAEKDGKTIPDIEVEERQLSSKESDDDKNKERDDDRSDESADYREDSDDDREDSSDYSSDDYDDDSSDSRDSRDDDDEGQASKIEFKAGKDLCLSVEGKVEGEKLIAEDCDDAFKFIFTETRLLKVEYSGYEDLCLEEDGEEVKLKECDDDEDKQRWHIIVSDDYNRIKNYDSGYFLELDGKDKVKLARGDEDEEKQQFEELDRDFFP